MNPRIAILAAGESARLGRPKQLIDWPGEPMLRHLCREALATGCPVAVVLGAHSASIRPAIADLPLQIIENAAWRDGMAGSIRAALTDDAMDSILLMVCDQPLVTTHTLGALINAEKPRGSLIVASAYAGTLGVPAIFDRALFEELRQLQGAQGAKALIQRHRAQVCSVPFPAGEQDLDTPDDLERLQTGSGKTTIDRRKGSL